jgi:hypothetical protein
VLREKVDTNVRQIGVDNEVRQPASLHVKPSRVDMEFENPQSVCLVVLFCCRFLNFAHLSSWLSNGGLQTQREAQPTAHRSDGLVYFGYPPCTDDEGVLARFHRLHEHVVAGPLGAHREFGSF